MVLTIDTLFNDPAVIRAVIDRTIAMGLDEIFWKRYMSFEETKARVFKSYLGTVTGVTAGSIIDRNSNKPLRQRQSLGEGVLEVAYLGDRYQIDNDRLDMLKSLIDKFNVMNTASQASAMNDIINYIVDDFRQVMLAPHKRMDLIFGDLRSKGKAEISLANNPQGITDMEITLPVHKITPATTDKTNFVKYLQRKIAELKTKYGKFQTMEMSLSTFNTNIIGSSDFGSNYKMIFGNAELASAGGIMTTAMANQIFQSIGLPNIRVVEDYVQLDDGTMQSTFADNRITLLQSDIMGKVKWHQPYEASDPIPGKTYTPQEGGHYISQVRTEEGRFMEYGAEWVPDVKNPNKIVIFELDTMNA